MNYLFSFVPQFSIGVHKVPNNINKMQSLQGSTEKTIQVWAGTHLWENTTPTSRVLACKAGDNFQLRPCKAATIHWCYEIYCTNDLTPKNADFYVCQSSLEAEVARTETGGL